MILRKIDRVLAPVTWIAAAFTVLVLLVGPELIGAEKPASAQAAADGATVFKESCASCHTLQAAGANGTSGPDLDAAAPDAAAVEAKVRAGGGGMPAFDGRLADAEIKAVSDYVASNAGG